LANEALQHGSIIGERQDHYKVEIAGQKIDINIAKTGKTIDLASAKALARAMGVKVFDLNRAIG
jgi:hypothetical protein